MKLTVSSVFDYIIFIVLGTFACREYECNTV